ncbi:MAG: porin [Gammaproteobacteria bacterium]|nr:porin [Gammaproteobacteria bacterium]
MNNKKALLGVVIANALAVPALVQANELEIYGTVAAAVESIDNGTDSFTQVNNNHSVFGIKGGTDLGDGLRGVFLFDTFLGTDSGDSGNGSLFGGGRDGYVGLEGSFGTVALGYHGRPWKTSTNNMDIFGSTIADYSALMGSTPGGAYFDGGIGNSVIWFLPDFNGLSGHVQFGADEEDDDTSDSGLQLNYSADNLYLTFSHDIDGQGSAPGVDDITATKVAGQFSFGASTVGIIFESISDSDANTRDAFWLAGSHKMGSLTLKLAFAQADDSDAAGDDGATYLALGLDHAFKENVTGYVIYSQISNDDNGSYGFVSAPHTSSNTKTTVAAGEDTSVLAVGVKVDFSLKK